MPYRAADLSLVRTYPLPQRHSRVTLDGLILPGAAVPSFSSADLDTVALRIVEARTAGRPVIWFTGGHLVKRGLAPVVIDLMEHGLITHLASNGAASIHDFEIALQGSTSEDVASSLETGMFGMAEETGRLMNMAIRAGARDGLGMGEALGRAVETGGFRYRQYSLLHAAYRLGIPYTVHVAIGTDIIHQHPAVDFAATGWASGQDFKIFTASVCDLEGGVFCNFGSAVLGPEVFLKALSIARNLGNPTRVFTTANFDLLPLSGDYHRSIGDDDPEYYYRPRKNIINRPVSLGGQGFHIHGEHLATIPNLRLRVLDHVQGGSVSLPSAQDAPFDLLERFRQEYPPAALVLQAVIDRYETLHPCVPELVRAFESILRAFRASGTLFLCGNGGSMADALHIAGELDKSFRHPRGLSEAQRQKLLAQPGGDALAGHLQQGLRTVPLGANPALTSAIANDNPLPHIGFAQELYALGRPGDVLLGISTSGNAQNVRYAASTAHALDMTVISLTGPNGGALAEQADIAIRAPGADTPEIQGWHIQLYHALCDMLEAAAFGE